MALIQSYFTRQPIGKMLFPFYKYFYILIVKNTLILRIQLACLYSFMIKLSLSKIRLLSCHQWSFFVCYFLTCNDYIFQFTYLKTIEDHLLSFTSQIKYFSIQRLKHWSSKLRWQVYYFACLTTASIDNNFEFAICSRASNFVFFNFFSDVCFIK